MLLSPRPNGLTSLCKEVRVFKVIQSNLKHGWFGTKFACAASEPAGLYTSWLSLEIKVERQHVHTKQWVQRSLFLKQP